MSQVYGDSVIVTVTPTITAGAYSAGDQVGGLQTIAAGYPARPKGSLLIQSITIIDKASQKAAMEIIFWSAAPTVVADNAAANYSDSDLGSKCVGKVTVAATDYATLAANSVATIPNVGLLMSPDAASTVYATVMTTGTPTYAATNDLVFKYGLGRDK
jgi:hypothetical protein